MEQTYYDVWFLHSLDILYPVACCLKSILEIQAAPFLLLQPVWHSCCQKSYDSYSDALSLYNRIWIKIWSSCIAAYDIRPKCRTCCLLAEFVIHVMPCLNIMIAPCYGIITEVIKARGCNILTFRMKIVKIIAQWLALEDVPIIKQYDTVRIGFTETVHIMGYP